MTRTMLPRVPVHTTRQTGQYTTAYRIDWLLILMVALAVLGFLAILGFIIVPELLDSVSAGLDRATTIGGY